MATHYDIARLHEAASTQDIAQEEAVRRGRPMLVIADRQTAGRGRGGRVWIEPDHGLFSSYAFRTPWPSDATPLFALVAAVAVRRAIDDVLGIDVGCKWPNDLVDADRKVGGILPDASDGLVTIGCGVNLAWNDPPDFATALLDTPPAPDVAPRLAVGWVDGFREILAEGPEAWPREEYEASCVTIGRRVRWEHGEGIATGVDAGGHLLVDGSDGASAVVSGAVHLLAHN